MQMHLHYMHILSILLDVQAQKKSRNATLCYLSFSLIQIKCVMCNVYGVCLCIVDCLMCSV